MSAALPQTPIADQALLDLLGCLQAAGYDFVTPTRSTHALVSARRAASETDVLRDAFGWARAFRREQLTPELFALMQAAGILIEDADAYKTALRVSSLDGRLFLHSAPTRDNDAVFLGPDSYRFASLLRRVLADSAGFRRALDIGTGAGVGAMTLQALAPAAAVYGSDINASALRLAGLNARHAGLPVQTLQASGVPEGPRDFDIIVANPPYVAGNVGKIYRDGGDAFGAALGLEWVRSGIRRLAPGGRFVLYTGAPIVAGRDVVRDGLTVLCAEQNLTLDYEEIDPDVFGQTLRQEAYRDVERIAAIGAVLTEP